MKVKELELMDDGEGIPLRSLMRDSTAHELRGHCAKKYEMPGLNE